MLLFSMAKRTEAAATPEHRHSGGALADRPADSEGE